MRISKNGQGARRRTSWPPGHSGVRLRCYLDMRQSPRS
ncbi:DUF6207 family protein [Streptomyces sp. HUAS TT20]